MADSEASRTSVSGPSPSQPSSRQASRRRHTRRWLGLAVVAALVATGGYGLTRDSQRDSDGDGLTDEIESASWSVQAGASYRTDPFAADTDRDGLTDGQEAGSRISPAQTQVVFAGFSNPLLADSDRDGLGDADEADLSLDPLQPDEDHDGLADGHEVNLVGTDPLTADTDGDGFSDSYEDANRESQGLDPLAFDVQVSSADYAVSFAKGFVVGDLWPEDSLPWLAGNLAAGASSSIPIVGTVVGGISDVRDAVAAAIHADWVGVGFSAVGVVPGGDVLAVPGKVSKFLARHPKLVVAVMAMVAKTAWIPDSVKGKIARYAYPRWDELRRAGASDKGLWRLMEAQVDLDRLANTVRRPNYVPGVASPFLRDGPAGEERMVSQLMAQDKNVDRQVNFDTLKCVAVCNAFIRRTDALSDGIAHESKVGAVALSREVRAQIQSDAWLIKTGAIKGALWEFYPSAITKTLGPNDNVLDLLEANNIPFTIHLP